MRPENPKNIREELDLSSINLAFSKQSNHYDQDDASNSILQVWRNQVYDHVNAVIKPNSRILELNAGTGIDALYFARRGHTILSTDVSDGMITQINKKIGQFNLHATWTAKQCSYEALDKIDGPFDYIFSNFGGLNCIDDLSLVTRHMKRLLTPDGFVTWTIMPPVCLWEILWALKGNTKGAFRRFNKKGVMAHLEGEYFRTYYHSLKKIRKAFGKEFHLLKFEGLGALSPPPSSETFPFDHPVLYAWLTQLDRKMHNHFPFNRWADHIIVTFRKKE